MIRNSILACFLAFSVPLPAQAQTDTPRIGWEITNRFAPFETLPDPEGTFRIYAPRPEDGGLDGWHKRLDAGGDGVTSPYARSLIAGRSLHWRPEAGEHAGSVTRFVQRENAAETTISVRLTITGADAGASCLWPGQTWLAPCDAGHTTRIPLVGADITVAVDGHDISARLTPQHKVIVALGDSYGSGEGNPDVPVQWKVAAPRPDNRVTWLIRSDNHAPLPDRVWVDDQCHRSFFSHQSLTALQLASDNPHVFVSFFHYACTGAEIFDGLIAPQYQAWGSGAYLPYAQVNAALRDLCQTPPDAYEAVTTAELDGVNLREFHRRGGRHGTGTLLRPNDALDVSTRKQRDDTGKRYPRSGLMTCPEAQLRKPDLVLLSIGGNDIGFNDLVSYYVVPISYKSNVVASILLPDVCPAYAHRVNAEKNPGVARHCAKMDRQNGYHAGDLIGSGQPGGMEARYGLALRILQHRLGVAPERIVMPQYPDPLRTTKPTGNACTPLTTAELTTFGSTAGVYDPLSPWNGLKSVAKTNLAWSWQFNMTPEETALLLRQFEDFRKVIVKMADEEEITLVCETRDAFVGHGWWQGAFQNLPNHRTKAQDDRWDVTLWRPYAYDPDGRAIRTGNDSVLTQPHRSTNFTGTAHPNLLGHRRVAEQVVATIRKKGMWPAAPPAQ